MMDPKDDSRPPPGDVPKRWTPTEVRSLTMGIGAFGIDYLVRKTGHTPKAIYYKIGQELGGGGLGRGTLPLRRLARETGYTRQQLARAGRALGQRWQRTSRTGRMMLSEDQAEALVEWLRHDYWCRRSHTYACVYCGRDDVSPKGLGLCVCCYARFRAAFRKAKLRWSKEALLCLVAVIRDAAPEADRDWLDAFETSLQEGCVLSRFCLRRLYRQATGQPLPPSDDDLLEENLPGEAAARRPRRAERPDLAIREVRRARTVACAPRRQGQPGSRSSTNTGARPR